MVLSNFIGTAAGLAGDYNQHGTVDTAEYPLLLQPILEGRADVVYGSRFIGESHRVLYFWHSVANKALTTLSKAFEDKFVSSPFLMIYQIRILT